MGKEELIGRLLSATPEELGRIEAVFTGTATAMETGDRRLYTLTAVARELNISRMTAFRMVNDGRLPSVETRNGRRRIPSAAISAFVNVGGRA